MWYELTRWYSYRRIKHPHMKYYVTVLPLTITLVLSLLYLKYIGAQHAMVDGGLIKTVGDIVMLLPGFFIAALAAVSTFQHGNLDELMDEEQCPTMPLRTQGKVAQTEITNRLFLCSLFSYLTAISFVILVIYGCVSVISKTFDSDRQIVEAILSSYPTLIGTAALVILYLFLFASLLVSGIHGLYFLSERIHRPSDT